MGHVIDCQAFYWVVRFSSHVCRAKLDLHSGSSVQAVVGYLYYPDGGGLLY
jgi:hypothetical protein